MFKKTLTIIILLTMIVGCASIRHVPLSQEIAVTLSGRVLQNTTYEKPDFCAMTADKAMCLGGIIGALASINAGNNIIEKNSVEDPAIYISEKLGLALSDKFGVLISKSKPVISESDDINDLISTYREADFILDIKTIYWCFEYFQTHWRSYRVMYGARLRLIDTQSTKVIAEEFCQYVPEYSEEAPSYDDLVNNNAAGLKAELLKAADYGIECFKDKAFGM